MKRFLLWAALVGGGIAATMAWPETAEAARPRVVYRDYYYGAPAYRSYRGYYYGPRYYRYPNRYYYYSPGGGVYFQGPRGGGINIQW